MEKLRNNRNFIMILAKSIKWFFVSIFSIILFFLISIFIFYKFFYYFEYNSIKESLEENPKIEIVKLVGNEDVTMEDIGAILKIKNKGKLSIGGLSKDVNHFPEYVNITEIGNYSFVNFLGKNAMSWNLNIGTSSEFYKLTKIKFQNVNDIVNHYDDIIKYVESFKTFPKYNLLSSENYEKSILFINKNEEMNYKNLKKYYNSECVADLQNEMNKTW